MKKIAVVTGTSTGLGIHIAVMLAKHGFTTIATMRNTDKQDALLAEAAAQSVQLTVKQLDVQDGQSVERCFADILAEHGAIDLLINNAGAGFVRTTEQATEAEIDWVMDVNFMGVVRCTKAVLPHMRERRAGHIINITSVGGLVGQPFNEFYCAAKFAVEGYTESLASYVQPAFDIKFSMIEPGGIATEFVSNVMSQVMATGGIHEDAYKPVLDQYMGGIRSRAASGETSSYQTAQAVAAVVLDCATRENPPLRMRTSAWAETFTSFKTVGDPDGSKQQSMVVSTFLPHIRTPGNVAG
jgi:NAD(P)-dependent dehydrogenase (short-subunit alcohol dehydrogenase family)